MRKTKTKKTTSNSEKKVKQKIAVSLEILSGGLVIVAIIGMAINGARLAREDACSGELSLEQVSECTSEEAREKFVELYRAALDEKVEAELSCKKNIVDIYDEYLENVDAARFPELYTDFIDRVMENEVSLTNADKVLNMMDSFYEKSSNFNTARLGILISDYFKDEARSQKYQDALITELEESGYSKNETITNGCKIWLGPTAANVLSDGNFWTRSEAAKKTTAINLYNSVQTDWESSDNKVNAALYSECQSLGLNQIYDFKVENSESVPENIYAGTPENPHERVISFKNLKLLAGAELIENNDTNKTYRKKIEISYCTDLERTKCHTETVPLEVKIWAIPTYFAASAVVVGDEATTVGPTRVTFERETKRIWAKIDTPVKIDFYHNVYSSIPLKNVPWTIERDFPSAGDYMVYDDEELFIGGEQAALEGDSYSGKMNLLSNKGIFYFKTGTSVRDYTLYPIRDSYEISFQKTGTYQFCEAVTKVGKSKELTKICAKIKVSD